MKYYNYDWCEILARPSKANCIAISKNRLYSVSIWILHNLAEVVEYPGAIVNASRDELVNYILTEVYN